MPTPVACIITAVVSVIVSGIICFILGIKYRKKAAEEQIGSAEEKATQIVNDAYKSADAKKKELLIEAKDEAHQLRTEADKEIRERRSEVQRSERRLEQKEQALDRKIENQEKKEAKLQQREKEVETKIAEAEEVKRNQIVMLEKISGFTKEQAKDYIIKTLENDLIHEKAVKVLDYEQQIKDECNEKAKEILGTAIQRCAADFSSEVTVSVVPLPNDEMKGRIIGREGRNIRAIETLTGCDIIIDDTPEAITLSCFDPVRREIARQALERLIADGRIHPSRIEETVEKARRDVEHHMKKEGERAVIETGVHGLHPELVKLLGRLCYRTSYGQNVLAHSVEVSKLSGLLAAEIGANTNQAKRAGLLHDLGKALDHEMEGSHIELGVEYAKKYKENDAIVHAIAAHHGDIEAKTVVACLVQAADAISAARPGARRENLENYMKRLEKLEEIANSFDGVEKSFAVQAGREIRIIVKPEKVNDDKMVLMAREIAASIEADLSYPGQIKVNVVRENRAVEYAK